MRSKLKASSATKYIRVMSTSEKQAPCKYICWSACCRSCKVSIASCKAFSRKGMVRHCLAGRRHSLRHVCRVDPEDFVNTLGEHILGEEVLQSSPAALTPSLQTKEWTFLLSKFDGQELKHSAKYVSTMSLQRGLTRSLRELEWKKSGASQCEARRPKKKFTSNDPHHDFWKQQQPALPLQAEKWRCFTCNRETRCSSRIRRSVHYSWESQVRCAS